VYEIREYSTPDGRNFYRGWFRKLRDTKAKLAISRRMRRIELGNFGDHKFCRDGVWELRIDVGAGYRVYYGLAGTRVVLLLCAGDKDSQSSDIDNACDYWNRWKGENHA
jgi:putative addiction module killer protein